MSEQEARLFEAFVRRADIYLEFGAGGSTCLAAQYARTIISVDSSDQWLSKVRLAVAEVASPRLSLHKIDIGPIGDWGVPTDPSQRNKWPAYSLDVWSEPDSNRADLCLVDGRFRVACFAETVARAQMGAIILFHDFESRQHYHVVKPLARCIAVSEDLSVFQKDASSDIEQARRLAEEFRYEPH